MTIPCQQSLSPCGGFLAIEHLQLGSSNFVQNDSNLEGISEIECPGLADLGRSAAFPRLWPLLTPSGRMPAAAFGQ